MDSWVFVTSAPLPSLSGDDDTMIGSDSGVGATEVGTECRTLTASSTLAEGVAEVVYCLKGGSQDEHSISGAGDAVTVTVSIVIMGLTVTDGVNGGVLQKVETAGVSATETVFTGAFAAISTDFAEANSADTFGDVMLVFASIGEDGVVTIATDGLVDDVVVSHMVGHDVKGGCNRLAAVTSHDKVDCVEAGEGLVWVTVGAQLTVAGAEMDACSNEVVPVLTAAAQDF